MAAAPHDLHRPGAAGFRRLNGALALAVLPAAALAGRAAAALGRPLALAGAVLVMLGGLALTLPDRLGLVVGGLVLFTAGFFAAHAVASGWAPVLGRSHPTGASALYVLAYYAGSSVFGAAVGAAWHRGGWGATAAAVGLLTAVGLAAGLVVTSLSRGRRGSGPPVRSAP